MSESEGVQAELAHGLDAQLRRWRGALEGGAGRLGWKIGINDPDVQKRFGLSHPVMGFLTADRRHDSGATLSAHRGARLQAEAEIAIFVGRDVPEGVSVASARSAIAGIGPALEIVDRSRGARDLAAILEDNLFHEAVVFGGDAPSRDGASLKGVVARVRRNGEEVASHDPRLAPSDLGALVKLVADLLGRHGELLRAGDRILSGSLVQPAPVRSGDAVVADLGPLGRAALRIELR